MALRRPIALLVLSAVLIGVFLAAVPVPAAAADAAQNQNSQTSQNQGAQTGQTAQTGQDILRKEDFNVFGQGNRELLSSGFGSWIARLLVRLMVIAFDVCLVAGIGLLFLKLALLLAGRAPRDSVLGRITDMGIALIGIILILTGGAAVLINWILRGAEEIKREVSFNDRPALAAPADPADGFRPV